MSEPEPTEIDWVHRSQEGDKHAFGHLVTKYMKQAYYAALGFLGSHEDALDASQEAFVKAYRNIDTFDPEKKFYTWYYRILKNHCLNVMRSRRSRAIPLSVVLQSHPEPAADGDAPDAGALKNELKQQIWDALWELDLEDRELIVARDFLNTPYATLAELLECPSGTVMSRLYHARQRLRKKLRGVI